MLKNYQIIIIIIFLISLIILNYKPVTKECLRDNDCASDGCSGELCGKKGEVEKIITTCVMLPEYECLKLTTCGCVNNKCQWKETDEYKNCMEKYD